MTEIDRSPAVVLGARDLCPVDRRSYAFAEIIECLPEIESLDILVDSKVLASRAGGEENDSEDCSYSLFQISSPVLPICSLERNRV